jgi:hypothetical protein
MTTISQQTLTIKYFSAHCKILYEAQPVLSYFLTIFGYLPNCILDNYNFLRVSFSFHQIKHLVNKTYAQSTFNANAASINFISVNKNTRIYPLCLLYSGLMMEIENACASMK